MGENSAIEWTDYTFNPWWGCTKVSPGCDHCYAETFANLVGQRGLWGTGHHRLFSGAHWREPLLWSERARNATRPPRVFCASMADVFDNQAPSHERERLFRLIKATRHLDWLILTKRVGNVRAMLPKPLTEWYQNTWLGISVVNQEEAARDIPKLVALPGKIKFLSCEPLLGRIDLHAVHNASLLDWIIVGGESGHGARPMDVDWVRAIQGYCALNGIAFFMKQGSAANWARYKEFEGFPADLRVRQWPTA